MYKLPIGWALGEINQLAVVTDYVANGSFASLKENVRYLSTPDYAVLIRVTDNNKGWSGNYVYVDKHAYDFLSKSKVFPGDIVVSNVGEPGQVFRVPDLNMPMTLGPNSVLIKPVSEEIDKGFFEYFIKSPYGQLLIHNITSATTQRKFNKTDFRKLQIPVAPVNEQRRIVAKLEKLLQKVDACKERLDKIPAIHKRFRQSVLAASCSGCLTADWRERHPDVVSVRETLYKIQRSRVEQAITPARREKIQDIYSYQEKEDSNLLPENWEYVSLDKLCDSFQYGTSKKSQTTGNLPVLRMGNIQNGQIDWTDLVYTSDKKEIEKYKLNPGDVLFNRTNSPELVGKTAIYSGEQLAAFAGYLIRINNFEELQSEYLNYCLNTPYAKEFCLQVKTDGVSQSNINAQKLGKFEVPFCSKEEQHEIVRRVEALFKIADQIEERYKKARTYVDKLTQSILAKAFRGELVPQDPNNEPASELLKRIKAECALK